MLSNSRTASLILLVIALFTAPLNAASGCWIRVSSAHFELYTANTPARAIQALEAFEEARAFFASGSESGIPGVHASGDEMQELVRIVAFASPAEFGPYRTNEEAVAYYQRSRNRDYIVLQDLGADLNRIAVHEYTHLMIERSHLHLPMWLNEGLAGLYSSLELKGHRASVGSPLTQHLAALASQPWLSISTLTGAGIESPYYNAPDKATMFYAESWALSHMMFSQHFYRSKFAEFAAATGAGDTAGAAFHAIYGKTLAEVGSELRDYVSSHAIEDPVFEGILPAVNFSAQIARLTPVQTDLVLADLLASHESTAAGAKEWLTQIAAEHPDSPEAEELLGYLSWRQGNASEAGLHFESAINKGSHDPEMLRDYAALRSFSFQGSLAKRDGYALGSKD